jgi:hypothetical protein
MRLNACFQAFLSSVNGAFLACLISTSSFVFGIVVTRSLGTIKSIVIISIQVLKIDLELRALVVKVF